MRFALFALLLLASAAACVLAGDSAAAAIQLGPGVSLYSPALSASGSSVSSISPLGLSASTSDLCPVIAYAASVDRVDSAELTQAKLTKGTKGQYATQAEQNANANAKPYKLIIKPLKYMHNQTAPSVDWIDLHFAVQSQGKLGTKQSVKMLRSAQSSAPMSHESMSSHDSMMPMAAPGSTFSFGPIFLSSNDQLLFAQTICASMIDCDSITHTFSPAAAEEAKSRKQQQQQELKLGSIGAQASLEQQQQQQEQQQSSSAPSAEPQQSSEHQSQSQSQQEQQQQGACPAIAFTHKLDCGDVQCKVSFVNLSPSTPLDWVDIHLIKTDRSALAQFLQISQTSSQQSAVRQLSGAVTQLNFPMTLAAGQQPRMMMHHSASSAPMTPMRSAIGTQQPQQFSSALSLETFGAASLPATVLAESGGAQVFQFELPTEFKQDDIAGVSFTYCASGTDCDTELFFYQLQDDGKQKQPQQQQQQEMKLGSIGVQASLDQQQQPQQQKQHSSLLQQSTAHEQLQQPIIPLGFRGSLNQPSSKTHHEL